MNTYFVYVRDDDANKPTVRMESYMGGLDVPEPVWCADVVEAESREQAKHLFLKKWTGPIRNPVYIDDWPMLRVRLLGKGALSEDESWHRIHEVLDHDGKACDCPLEPEREELVHEA